MKKVQIQFQFLWILRTIAGTLQSPQGALVIGFCNDFQFR